MKADLDASISTELDPETKKDQRRRLVKVEKALLKLQSAKSLIDAEESSESQKPREPGIAVFYLAMTYAGGIMPKVGKFGVTEIPYDIDWLPSFKPLTNRYGTSYKQFVVFRWICNHPYSKAYEAAIRAQLEHLIVRTTKYADLPQEFKDAVAPFMNASQNQFRLVVENKHTSRTAPDSYRTAYDAVTAAGPRGFYANWYYLLLFCDVRY
jgi:hypothetical protein